MLKTILSLIFFLFIISCNDNSTTLTHPSVFVEGNSMIANINGEKIVFDSVFGFYQYSDIITNASDDGQNYFRIKGFNREKNIGIGMDIEGGYGGQYDVRHAAFLLNNQLYTTWTDGPEMGYTNNLLNNSLDLTYNEPYKLTDQPNMPTKSEDTLYIYSIFIDDFQKGGRLWNDKVTGHFSFKINKWRDTIKVEQASFSIENLIPGNANIQNVLAQGFTVDKNEAEYSQSGADNNAVAFCAGIIALAFLIWLISRERFRFFKINKAKPVLIEDSLDLNTEFLLEQNRNRRRQTILITSIISGLLLIFVGIYYFIRLDKLKNNIQANVQQVDSSNFKTQTKNDFENQNYDDKLTFDERVKSGYYDKITKEGTFTFVGLATEGDYESKFFEDSIGNKISFVDGSKDIWAKYKFDNSLKDSLFYLKWKWQQGGNLYLIYCEKITTGSELNTNQAVVDTQQQQLNSETNDTAFDNNEVTQANNNQTYSVQASISYFYNQPDYGYKRKGHVIAGDAVIIKKISDDGLWGYAVYTSSTGTTSEGWLLMKTLQTSAETSITSNKVICSQNETANENGGDPILIKTCLYKNYKTISNAYPDYKGRYSYKYFVYAKHATGSYIQIKNASLFNQKRDELLSMINSKIEKDYNLYSNDPETKDCFAGSSFTPFNFEQLGIDFSQDKIYFHVTFGLGGACMNVDGTEVSFNLDEIQKYLNE